MSMASRISLVLVVFSVCATAQGRLTVDEILVLLSAGVSAEEVDGLVERRGGPAAVEEGDLVAVRAAGGSEELGRRLSGRLRSHQRLRDLAGRFDVWRHEAFGISLLYPKGWLVSPSLGDGQAVITIQRDAGDPLGWFDTPRLFVWVQRETPFPRASQRHLAAKIAELVQARLGAAGMEPRVLSGAAAPGFSASPEECRMVATVPGLRFEGKLVLRTRVLGDGAVVTTGYTCAGGDEAAVRGLFEELARSLELRAG